MKESIVLHAWEIITRYPSLKKLNFFPSLVGVLWLFMILMYQLTFTYVSVFHKKDELIEAIVQFAHKDYFFEVLLGLGSIFLFYMFLAPIAEGGILEMIHSYRRSEGQRVRRTFQGIFDGFRHFLPLFEAHNVISIFRPLSIITFYILLLRLFGKEYFIVISYMMGGYLLFAFFLNMCFAYSKYFIVFEHMGVIEALGASTSMAIRHINITIQLYYTMILLYLRTILVAFLFLILPFALSSVIAFFSILGVKMILITISLIACGVLFILIAHLNSTLEIFVEATWYEAYILCKKEDAEDGYGGGHDSHGGHDDHHGDHGWHGWHGEHDDHGAHGHDDHHGHH